MAPEARSGWSDLGACAWQVMDLRRALHAEPGSAEAMRLAALRAEDVRAAMQAPAPAAPPTPATAPHHHTFDAVMQHHALRTHTTVDMTTHVNNMHTHLCLTCAI